MPIVFADTLPASWDLVADIQILLHYHFMQNAYLAGTLVAITAGIMGYFMVLRSQSFAGHSLANVGFAGATGAVLYNILFGNVLGISDTDVSIIIWSTLVLLGVLLVIARPLCFASLDPDVAEAS